ncbi:hypothetical protein HZB03_04705 [Candidatus Woesearchaeota archaeon]|nr:hypothetical protein [Candidatus Woesearchaeota archaeon]
MIVIVVLVSALILLTACKPAPCKTVPVKFYERQQYLVPNMIEKNESYTYTVPKFTKKCYAEPIPQETVTTDKYSLEIGPKVWLFEPLVLGESNQLKRTIYLKNLQQKKDTFFMDKVYLMNGSEVQRWKHSGLYGIDANSSRRFFVTWSTQYDPAKDVTIQVVDENNELATSKPQEKCIAIEEAEEKTGTRKVLVTENDVKYTPVVKERQKKVCNEN